MKTVYCGYCEECGCAQFLREVDYGVDPNNHDWRLVCPEDAEHTVTDIDEMEQDHD